jgi:hypothetical protein
LEAKQRGVILRWTDVTVSMNKRHRFPGTNNAAFTSDSVRKWWFKLQGFNVDSLTNPTRMGHMRSMKVSSPNSDDSNGPPSSESGDSDDPDLWLKAEDDFLGAIFQLRDPNGAYCHRLR